MTMRDWVGLVLVGVLAWVPFLALIRGRKERSQARGDKQAEE